MIHLGHSPLRLPSTTNSVVQTMAGDHKCPVCQSTFTRPQHVARHMRSHTGDRPYKCQHCGDQFARSDLLSRHVNKCHAAERPPTTTAPNRRKGAAAASRATTSKQACDQCVQSSLPCDGANPCSKCVQRKCRCTYVKFHRQTAPQGPGHPVPNQIPPAGRTLLPGTSRLPEEFLVAPAQTSYAFPTMYNPNPSGDYALPPTSTSMYPHAYTHAVDPRESPAPPIAMAANSRDAMDGSPDIMSRYRVQAELLSRAGVLPNGSLSVGPTAGAPADGALPAHALYNDPQAQAHFSRYSLPMPAAPAWAQSQNSHSFQPVDHRKEYESFPASRQPFPERQGNIHANTGEPSLQTHPPAHGTAFPSISSSAGNPGSYAASSVPFHHRAEDLNDDFASDAGSTGRSHSIPNSANSSSIHLPMPEQQSRQHNYSLPGFTHVDAAHDQDAAGNHGQNNAYKTEYASGGAFGHDGQGEGGFSSAFGLMSLDDPNILAGLSSDSAPFFSNIPSSNSGSASGMNLPTPTQDFIAALKTGKSDADSKEMRDFWKMYVRTPLSGPGSANGLALATPTGPGHMLGAGRPSPTRRHSRVASLPSMKTPPIHADVNLNAFPSINRFTLSLNDNSRNQHRRADPSREQRGNNDTNTNAFSSIRTTLHDGEDLKSYEQAVLARKAPMNLNLVPKRRGTMPASITAPSAIHLQDSDTHASKSVSPVAPHLPPPPPPPYMSNKIPDLLNRPSSTASNSSSLAHAFGAQEHAGQPQQRSRPPSQSGYEAMRPPSVASSTAVGSLSDAGTDSDSSYRPSFKRLASQTLGPDNAKRALLGPAGWDDDAVDDDDDDDGDYMHQRTRSSGASAGQDSTQKYEAAVDRPMVGISDRHRRASCPTTGVLPGMGPGFVQPMERGEAPATGS